MRIENKLNEDTVIERWGQQKKLENKKWQNDAHLMEKPDKWKWRLQLVQIGLLKKPILIFFMWILCVFQPDLFNPYTKMILGVPKKIFIPRFIMDRNNLKNISGRKNTVLVGNWERNQEELLDKGQWKQEESKNH